MKTVGRALFAVLPPLAAAAIGGVGARNAPEVYERLDKPDWAPPAGLFGPVWSVLYTLNGVAGWRIAGRGDRRLAALHVGQLGLNTAWTPLFFSAGRRREALAVNLALDVVVAAEIVRLWRTSDRPSAVMLAPYLAWSGFASALTASVGDPDPSA